MGHYDSAYEHSANESNHLYKLKLKAALKDVQKLREHAKTCLPVRFMDDLEDCENWLKVQIKEPL
jgi:hypothetical protein